MKHVSSVPGGELRAFDPSPGILLTALFLFRVVCLQCLGLHSSLKLGSWTGSKCKSAKNSKPASYADGQGPCGLERAAWWGIFSKGKEGC